MPPAQRGVAMHPQRGRSLAKRLGRHQRPAGTEPFVFLAQSGQGGSRQSVEAAIELAGIVGHVTLIEFDTALRADAVLQRKLRSLANVTVFTNAQTTEITGDAQKVNGLVYKDRASGQSRTVPLEGVFIQIGLVPNTDWLKGTIELSKHGEIVVDARGQTSVPGVFPAGDSIFQSRYEPEEGLIGRYLVRRLTGLKRAV